MVVVMVIVAFGRHGSADGGPGGSADDRAIPAADLRTDSAAESTPYTASHRGVDGSVSGEGARHHGQGRAQKGKARDVFESR
jgi:hypothetical protein